jgi:hypothetical protein
MTETKKNYQVKDPSDQINLLNPLIKLNKEENHGRTKNGANSQNHGTI